MLTDLHCPHCRTTHALQAVPALHATGTSTAVTTGDYHGVGFTPYGVVPVVATATRTSTHSTALASALNPGPGTRPIEGLLVWGTLALLLPLIMMLPVSAMFSEVPELVDLGQAMVVGIPALIASSVPTIACYWVALARARQNQRIRRGRPLAHAVWAAGLYCHRCGCCFWPEPTAPGVPVREPLTPAAFTHHVWRAGRYLPH
ncbi:hypothetical protein IU469_29930 [Nocardia puris]|uniref:hypothetical protein n=1 Tax=Nocardia puris TaxID=208602 RepID=UPI0018952720|nr:hypothetical protein [Nocardia puris]MBF6215496.1 hypothetical protein [Nocardia puris]MBF6369899.1 hypothetical protein [Nocardia puris]